MYSEAKYIRFKLFFQNIDATGKVLRQKAFDRYWEIMVLGGFNPNNLLRCQEKRAVEWGVSGNLGVPSTVKQYVQCCLRSSRTLLSIGYRIIKHNYWSLAVLRVRFCNWTVHDRPVVKKVQNYCGNWNCLRMAEKKRNPKRHNGKTTVL